MHRAFHHKHQDATGVAREAAYEDPLAGQAIRKMPANQGAGQSCTSAEPERHPNRPHAQVKRVGTDDGDQRLRQRSEREHHGEGDAVEGEALPAQEAGIQLVHLGSECWRMTAMFPHRRWRIAVIFAGETKGGDSYTGLLAGETPGAITLRMAQGIEQQILRADIATMTISRLSLMPQELEKAMTNQELADVLAFLKGE